MENRVMEDIRDSLRGDYIWSEAYGQQRPAWSHNRQMWIPLPITWQMSTPQAIRHRWMNLRACYIKTSRRKQPPLMEMRNRAVHRWDWAYGMLPSVPCLRKEAWRHPTATPHLQLTVRDFSQFAVRTAIPIIREMVIWSLPWLRTVAICWQPQRDFRYWIRRDVPLSLVITM